MGINFWCAECGQALAADDTDAGREVECGKCRAVVRVPRNPVVPSPDPAADSPQRPAPVFAAADADAARAGIRLVAVSFWLFLAGTAVSVAVLVVEEGAGKPPPAAVRTAVDGFDLFTLVVGCVLRVLGYVWCRRVGRILDVEWALTCGIVGAVTTTLGLTIFAAIDAATASAPDSTLEVLGYVLLAAALIGAIVELAVLAFFRQILADTRPPDDARLVTGYLTLLVGIAIAVPCGWIAYIFFTSIAGMIRSLLIGNPAWMPVPPEVLFAWVVGGVAGLILVTQLVLHYTRILSRCRAGLAAATQPGPA